MGNSASRLEFKGYHVLKVRETSPAAEAGLKAYFDFIVAVNGQSLNNDPVLFPGLVKNSIGAELVVSVYSAQTKTQRNVILVPRIWAGQEDGVLGCSLRYCNYTDAYGCSWHITNVVEGSPAYEAGLYADDDYIVGSPDNTWTEPQELYAKFAESETQRAQVRLLIYNKKDKSVRETVVMPRKDWGGAGLIGAVLATGALHCVPVDPESDDFQASKEITETTLKSVKDVMETTNPGDDKEEEEDIKENTTERTAMLSKLKEQTTPSSSASPKKTLLFEVQQQENTEQQQLEKETEQQQKEDDQRDKEEEKEKERLLEGQEKREPCTVSPNQQNNSESQ